MDGDRAAVSRLRTGRAVAGVLAAAPRAAEPRLAVPALLPPLLAAAAGGAAYALSLAPVGLWILAPAGPAFLFMATVGRSLPAAALAGAVWAGVAFAALLSWMAGVGLPLYLALVALLAATGAAGGATLAVLPVGTWRYALAPVVLLAWEALRVAALHGFAWGLLAGWAADTSWLSAARIVGASGLTLAAADIGASGWALLRLQRCVAVWLAGASALLLLPGVLLPPPSEPPVRVAAVQTWMTNDAKWDPARLGAVLDELHALTGRAASAGAQLVVWPETAIPADPFRDAVARDALRRAATEHGVWVAAGALATAPPQRSDPQDGGKPVNLLLLIAPDGSLRGVYGKVHRVPFGEPVLASGPGYRALAWDRAPIGAVLSWEVQSSAPVRAYLTQGVGVLIAPTSTAWANHRGVGAQQLQLAALRAAEAGRPLVLAANGPAAVFDARGRAVARGRGGQSDALVATVRLGTGTAPGPTADVALRVAAVLVATMVWAIALVDGSRFAPARPRGPDHAGSMLASAAGTLGGAMLLVRWAIRAGMPLGLPPLWSHLPLAAAGAAVGVVCYLLLWHAVANRWGTFVAALFVTAAVWLAAGVLPPEGMAWVRLAALYLSAVRAWIGSVVGPSVGLAIVAAVLPLLAPSL